MIVCDNRGGLSLQVAPANNWYAKKLVGRVEFLPIGWTRLHPEEGGVPHETLNPSNYFSMIHLLGAS